MTITSRTSRPSPYPGLRPYNEDERERFFGREAEVSVLIDKILAHRLTLLFAATGVGKSSLLKAAVIPQLKSPHGQNLTVVYYSDWVSPPLDGLQTEIRQALQASGAWSANMAQSVDTSSGLTDFLELCTLFVKNHPLIIVLDQFEEFFRYRKKYHQHSFRPFIEQLTALITSPQLPVSLVFSMREDFALELNAFKPKLSGLLFDNYFRLERLTARAARHAVAAPVEQIGFRYEPALLDQLISDLLNRDLDRNTSSLEPSHTSMTGFLNPEAKHPPADLHIDEELETVEPPYLQIVCSQLWEQEQNSPDQTLHLETYHQAGSAKGLLKNYLQQIFRDFTHREKQIASRAFDHLISHRGTKMAHTPHDLAKLIHIREKELSKLLEKLTHQRVLRSQQRAEQIWYELYHDMFSDSIDEWNTAWKSRQRKRNTLWGSSLFILLAGIASLGIIAYVNHTTHHFRLGTAEDSRIEVYRGRNGWPDPFGQQGFVYELEITRDELESDKQFEIQAILNYPDLYNELIGYQPLEQRVINYIDKGDFIRAIDLTQQVLASNNQGLSKKVLRGLFHLKARQAFDFLQQKALTKPEGYIDNQQAELQQIVKTLFRENTLSLPINNLAEFNFFYDDFRQLQSYHFEQNIWAIADPRLIRIIIELLQHENPDIQRAAIQVLGQSSASAAVPQLVQYLQDDNSEIRKFASQALGRIGDPSTATAILPLLNNEDIGVREQSALALGYLGNPANIPQLTAQLQDTVPTVRFAAVDALGRIGAAVPVPDIIQRLRDEDEGVRKAAVKALGRIGEHAVIPELRSVLQDQKPRVRNEAIGVLGKFSTQYTVQELLVRLQSADELIRREAVSALEQLSHPDTIGQLIQALQHEDDYVRQYATQALGNIGDFNSIQALARQLDAPQIEIKYYAARALGNIASNTLFSLSALLQCLDNQPPSSPVQHKCIEALGEDGAAFAVPKLRQHLYSENKVVRDKTAHALWQMGIPYTVKFTQYGQPDPLRWSDFSFERLNEISGTHQDKSTLLILLNQLPSQERNQQLLSLVKRRDVHFSIREKALTTLAATADTAFVDFLKTLNPSTHLKNITTQLPEQFRQHTLAAALSASPANPQSILNALQYLKTDTSHQSAVQVRQWLVDLIRQGENDFSSAVYRLAGDLQLTKVVPVLQQRLQTLTAYISSARLETAETTSQRHMAFDYGYALTRLDPAAGMQLLTHPLSGVRQGAYTGFAMQADIQWLQTLDNARRNTHKNNPVFQYAAFRAIDLGLQRLEVLAESEAIVALREWQATFSPQHDLVQEDEVLERIQWTIRMMEHYQQLEVEFKHDYGLKRVWPVQKPLPGTPKPLPGSES